MVAPSSGTYLVCLCLGLAAASDPYSTELFKVNDTCVDEATSFLQRGSHKRMALEQPQQMNEVKQIPTSIAPLDCKKHKKPIQVIESKGKGMRDGYAVSELEMDMGSYTEIFFVPKKRAGFAYQRLNACGISPIDSIVYCAMLVEKDKYYFLVRIDDDDIEFVAKLPYERWTFANSAGFSPRGTFFISDHFGSLFVIKDVDNIAGKTGADREACLDLSNATLVKPAGFKRADDIVVANVDLQGNGPEEYVFILGQFVLNLAKYDPAKEEFVRSWTIGTTPFEWNRFYGAGWNYGNQVFFSDNLGRGVYQVPMDYLKVILMASDISSSPLKVKLDLVKVGETVATTSNDGMNCMDRPSPWTTEITQFDCASYPVPIQVMIRDKGYEMAYLDYQSGNYTNIYNIPNDRTDPPFRVLNAFAISPMDSIVYASLVIDEWNDTAYPKPPPFYIVRLDSQIIEFVAKIQAAAGSPIAGAFDADGNYFVVSNPSLFKFSGLEGMKGFSNPTHEDLPLYNMMSPEVAIANMTTINQIADIVALKANFDGAGDATWVLGVNAFWQGVAVKVTGKEAVHYGFPVYDLLDGAKKRQNLGSAWNFNGEVFFASNDGEGVFKVPLDKVKVPGGEKVQLQRVGNSEPVHDNDGFNCFYTSSPFAEKPGHYAKPFGRDVTPPA